jgi:hypothetical protein
MMKEKTLKSPPLRSRRSGFDRRWIPSENHQPERRRGKDRRKTRKRSFLVPLDPEVSESSGTVFPEIDPDRKTPSSTPSLSVERWSPRHLEMIPEEASSEED